MGTKSNQVCTNRSEAHIVPPIPAPLIIQKKGWLYHTSAQGWLERVLKRAKRFRLMARRFSRARFVLVIGLFLWIEAAGFEEICRVARHFRGVQQAGVAYRQHHPVPQAVV